MTASLVGVLDEAHNDSCSAKANAHGSGDVAAGVTSGVFLDTGTICQQQQTETQTSSETNTRTYTPTKGIR